MLCNDHSSDFVKHALNAAVTAADLLRLCRQMYRHVFHNIPAMTAAKAFLRLAGASAVAACTAVARQASAMTVMMSASVPPCEQQIATGTESW